MENARRESGPMAPGDLKGRTKRFALEVTRLADSLPRTRAGNVIGYQLLRSGTSVAANYRAACRSRSRREFIAKLGLVLEEADESQLWLELVLAYGKLLDPGRIHPVLKEAGELVAIMVSSIRTAKGKRRPILHSAFPTQHSQS